MIPPCGFSLHFPNDVCCGASFHMLIYHLYNFFGGVSFKFSDHF